DVLLYDGTPMHLGWMTEPELAAAIAAGGRPAEVLRELRDLRDRYASRIRKGYPKLPRRVSGYNLDQLLPGEDGRFNLARTLVGTEGTCATTVEATVRLVDLRPERVIVAIGYKDIYEAGDRVTEVLAAEPDPMSLEGMDKRLYDHIRLKDAPSARSLKLLPDGHGWLFVQIGADSREEAVERGRRLAEAVRARAVDVKVMEDHEQQHDLWEMREGGLGATAFVPGQPDSWEGWEDSAVPPDR